MKKATYWDVLSPIMKQYRHALYRSKLYWLSAIVIIAGFISMICLPEGLKCGSILFLAGIILLVISKLVVLNQPVKK